VLRLSPSKLTDLAILQLQYRDKKLQSLPLGAGIFLQILTKGIKFRLPELLVIGNPIRHFFQRVSVEAVEALASCFALGY
jgi:hypothetical protein